MAFDPSRCALGLSNNLDVIRQCAVLCCTRNDYDDQCYSEKSSYVLGIFKTSKNNTYDRNAVSKLVFGRVPLPSAINRGVEFSSAPSI